MKKQDMISRNEKIIYLPLDKITPNRAQPRRRFNPDELNELAQSVRENGILQPITVRRVERGYLLVAGERRLRASHIAGLREIPCLVIDADEKQMATLALLENLQRSDLDFFEEANAYAHIMKLSGITQEELARKLGKSQSAISNKLRLLKLGHNIITQITDANLTERHARALLRLPDESTRLATLRYIVDNSLNVYDADEYIDSLLRSEEKKKRDERRAKQQYVIKDVRLFYNTIGKAIDTMRRSGIRADMQKNETESCIDLTIKIFK